MKRFATVLTLIAAGGAFNAPPALSSPHASPTLTLAVRGFAKVRLRVRAGATAAPAGFTVQWMRLSDFIDNGGQWYPGPSAIQGVATFDGVPTLNDWGAEDYILDANELVTIEIGDLLGETGVTTNQPDELEAGTQYVFAAFVVESPGYEASARTADLFVSTRGGQDCTYTIGYWKNHEEDWPVTSLLVGDVSYTKAQLLDILHEPVRGNGLISMSHQLIGTKLNVANGAGAIEVLSTILAADALIAGLVIPPVGSGYLQPSTTSPHTQTLDDFNNGIVGPGHCGSTGVEASTWGRIKGGYR